MGGVTLLPWRQAVSLRHLGVDPKLYRFPLTLASDPLLCLPFAVAAVATLWLVPSQVEFANVLVLNKTDLITAAEQHKVLALLKTLNPSATILTTQHSSVPVESVLHTGSFSWEAAQAAPGWVQLISRFEQQQHHHHDHDHTHEHGHSHSHNSHEHGHGEHSQHSEAAKYGISSFVYYAQRPFHPGRLLEQALSQSWRGVLRSKGFYWLATRHDVMGLWQSAGGAWQGEPRWGRGC